MKISYRTHPPLRYLDVGQLDKIWIDESEITRFNIVKDEINGYFKKYLNSFRDVSSMSLAFCQAADIASKKLFDNGKFVNIQDLPNNSGTLLFHNKTCFYNVEKGNFCFMLFYKEFLHAYVNVNVNDVITSHFYSYQHLGLLNEIHPIESVEQVHIMTIMLVLKYIVFANYAEIEIKHLPAGQKTNHIECKYINETKSLIKILNSTWFTTLVKSDAFKVRGHLRLQPCGEGMKDRKIIWINDFIKDGYTAPARKLSQQP